MSKANKTFEDVEIEVENDFNPSKSETKNEGKETGGIKNRFASFVRDKILNFSDQDSTSEDEEPSASGLSGLRRRLGKRNYTSKTTQYEITINITNMTGDIVVPSTHEELKLQLNLEDQLKNIFKNISPGQDTPVDLETLMNFLPSVKSPIRVSMRRSNGSKAKDSNSNSDDVVKDNGFVEEKVFNDGKELNETFKQISVDSNLVEQNNGQSNVSWKVLVKKITQKKYGHCVLGFPQIVCIILLSSIIIIALLLLMHYLGAFAQL